jgi:hypothetical protein
MNAVDLNPAGALAGDSDPIEQETYSTTVGGMASCPTGAAIYLVPIHSGTPTEVVIGGEGHIGPQGRADLMETRPSFELWTILGPTIAETMKPWSRFTDHLGCQVIEHQKVLKRLSMATYLSQPMVLWEEARRLMEELEAPSHEEAGPRSWEAFKDLAQWLPASDGEVAEAIGIGRTTVYTWQRENREPRQGTARRIHQLHAALKALRSRLGPAGLDSWLSSGAPSRREVILSGDLELLSDEIDTELFSAISQPDLSAAPPDRGGVDPLVVSEPPRPSRRRPRRAKLP